MDSITSLVTDDRIALAVAVEPGDATTATVLAAVGAQETLRLLTSADPVPVVETEAAALWRDLAAPRLRPQAVQQVMDATRHHHLHVSIPGDPEWPEGFAIGGVTHRGALGAGGKTIAVLAGGLDKPYPAGNQELFNRIAARGALLSEIPPGCAPTKLRIMQRARLLAALSDTTVIVEAGFRSGSLLVAAHASAFGRDVGAVPGPITSAYSSGAHELLSSGTARIITGAHDIQMPEPPTAGSLNAPGVEPGRTDLTVETVRSYKPNLGSREGKAREDDSPAFVAATRPAAPSGNAPRL